MKYTYAIGDIHGCFKELNELLEQINIFQHNVDMIDGALNEHQIIFMGDYIDRGPDSPNTVSRLMKLQLERPNTIFLKGNHDAMFVAGEAFNHYNTNHQYENDAFDRHDLHTRWLDSLPLWHEDEHNYFVHGGLPLDKHPSEVRPDMLLWLRDTEDKPHKKFLIVGHTPLGQTRPIQYEYGMNVDGGAVFGGYLLCAVLEDGIYKGTHIPIKSSFDISNQ